VKNDSESGCGRLKPEVSGNQYEKLPKTAKNNNLVKTQKILSTKM